MKGQDGTRGIPDHTRRHATQQHAAQAALAVSTHHNQADLGGPGVLGDGVGRQWRECAEAWPLLGFVRASSITDGGWLATNGFSTGVVLLSSESSGIDSAGSLLATVVTHVRCLP
jgi:hypothetical protein